MCSGQLDRHEKNRNNRPGMEYHQGGKLQVPGNGQNWENKDLAPRITFPPWHIGHVV